MDWLAPVNSSSWAITGSQLQQPDVRMKKETFCVPLALSLADCKGESVTWTQSPLEPGAIIAIIVAELSCQFGLLCSKTDYCMLTLSKEFGETLKNICCLSDSFLVPQGRKDREGHDFLVSGVWLAADVEASRGLEVSSYFSLNWLEWKTCLVSGWVQWGQKLLLCLTVGERVLVVVAAGINTCLP